MAVDLSTSRALQFPQSIGSSREHTQDTAQGTLLSSINLPKPSLESRKYEIQRRFFTKNAQALLNRSTSITSAAFPSMNEEPVRQAADEAFPYLEAAHEKGIFYSGKTKIHVFGGFEHRCVTTDKLPGFLFKKRKDAAAMHDHVALADKARKICEENGLHLLYVPKCQVVSSNESIIIEEKLNLVGDVGAQKACYRGAIEDPNLQPYIKEVFRQLIIFICKMGFTDVSYQNIPITSDGRIALIDLDQKGSADGLMGDSRYGVFNILPFKWYHEFVPLAKSLLQEKELERFQFTLENFEGKAAT